MEKFTYAKEVKIGSIFERVDKNGMVWQAEVIERTDKMVKVLYLNPYDNKVYSSNRLLIMKIYNTVTKEFANYIIRVYDQPQKTYRSRYYFSGELDGKQDKNV